MQLSSHTLSPAAPACPPPTLFLDIAPPPPSLSLFVSPPTIGRRYINISPFSALVVAPPPPRPPPFPFSPRGYCLPLSAILSAACDQTGEPQCASEGPAEGGSQTPFNHVMPQLCQLVGCQTKILAVYEVAARVSCPLRLPRTHRMSSS